MRLKLTTLAMLICTLLSAQAPALIPHQGVARNGSGEPLSNTTISVRFTLHHATVDGTVVWQELQTLQTNAFGLFTAQLGSTVSLANVNWANGDKFLQVELNTGNGFIDIGTQQLLSVPYALHAGSVRVDVSPTGDTLFVGDGSFVIVPGISEANTVVNGSSQHTCGTALVHNPNLSYGTMTDQEGNSYKTIVIGTQEWMAENLNTGIYRNGDAIATGLSSSAWNSTTSGAWASYANNASNACPYGKLYNWYAVDDARGLCPAGWHVPDNAEWNTLEAFLGGNQVAGGALKSTGNLDDETGLWSFPNAGAANSSGFSALPGGYRLINGAYLDITDLGEWWSSTELDADSGNSLYVLRQSALSYFGAKFKDNGFSVRCIRD